MINIRQLLFALVFIVPGLLFAQSKVAVYGSIWEKGNESECNWYFKGDLACMQLIFKGSQNETIETRLIMNSQTNKLTVVTKNNETETCISVSADSIKKETKALLAFKSIGNSKEIENLGTCVRFNAKNHTNEYLVYVFENNAISLHKFKNFIKNDIIFEFFSASVNHQFPAQALSTTSTGELQRSFIVSSINDSFSEEIFAGACE